VLPVEFPEDWISLVSGRDSVFWESMPVLEVVLVVELEPALTAVVMVVVAADVYVGSSVASVFIAMAVAAAVIVIAALEVQGRSEEGRRTQSEYSQWWRCGHSALDPVVILKVINILPAWDGSAYHEP
jgi:hypothetical protein